MSENAEIINASENREEAVSPAEAVEKIENVEGAIEAILYAAGYPVTFETLSRVIGFSPKDIKGLVEHMASVYNAEGSLHGISLLIFEDSCQFCTKEAFAPYIREALGIKRGGNLSNSSLEALSIVAYNQPVTRSFVDTVRGVDSSYAMTSLLEKELIAPCGRLDAPGRPVLYKTTEKFLRVFGLNSISELPETETLSNRNANNQFFNSDNEDADAEQISAEISFPESDFEVSGEDEQPDV